MKFVSLSRPLLLLAAGLGLSLTANADGHHGRHHRHHHPAPHAQKVSSERSSALDGQHLAPQPKDGPKQRRHHRLPPHHPPPAPKPTPPPGG